MPDTSSADPVEAFNRGRSDQGRGQSSLRSIYEEVARRESTPSRATGYTTARHSSVALFVTAIVVGATCGVFSVFIGAVVPSQTRWI